MSDDAAGSSHDWMPRERWEGLVRGDGCPLCDPDVGEPENPFSFLVAELSVSYLRLGRNQHLAG